MTYPSPQLWIKRIGERERLGAKVIENFSPLLLNERYDSHYIYASKEDSLCWLILALHEVFENQALTRGFLLYVYREGKLFEPIKST